MPQQYVATDSRTGLEVAVTGQFPDDPEDRVRIARTSTLFTRLMSTILAMQQPSERRDGFRAVETQLEVAEALLRGDMEDVQRLLRSTVEQMGVTEEQLELLQEELRRRFEDLAHEIDLGKRPEAEEPPEPQPHDADQLERGPFRDALPDEMPEEQAPDEPIELGPAGGGSEEGPSADDEDERDDEGTPRG